MANCSLTEELRGKKIPLSASFISIPNASILPLRLTILQSFELDRTNHKGGVGKTTTTINLAAALRQKKKRVLAIDMDGQANLTESCGLSIEEEQTVYGAMRGEYPLPVIELENGLAVVPSCLDLSAAESELINEPGVDTERPDCEIA